jgi:uncharacterized protein (TIGR02266 family)
MTELGKTVERRSAIRVPVEIWVEQSTVRELYFQRSANISQGGIFLQQTIPHARGAIVNLRFTLPGDDHAFQVSGEIVNVGETASELGMGIRFIDLADADRRRIESFVARTAEFDDRP